MAGLGTALWISRLEPAATVRERERVQHDLPLALELTAACLAVGCPVGQALAAVSHAVGGPLGARLDAVAARLSLGSDPSVEWGRLSHDPHLAGLAAAVQRSLESGAPLAEGLTRLAKDRRRERRTRVQQRARRVGVQAAAPLALCFLPAFMLVGVVPVVAGSLSRLIG